MYPIWLVKILITLISIVCINVFFFCSESSLKLISINCCWMLLSLIKLHTHFLTSFVCLEKRKKCGEMYNSFRKKLVLFLLWLCNFSFVKYVKESSASKRNVLMSKKVRLFKVFATGSAKIEALLCSAAFFKSHTFREVSGSIITKLGKPIVNSG